MALASVCGLNKSHFTLSGRQKQEDENLEDIISPIPKFDLPPGQNPVDFLAPFTEDGGESGMKIHFNHGTTTLGFKFKHGVIIAVDSRATAGQWIDWTDICKVINLGPCMLGTMAGGSADCQYLLRVIKNEARIYELRNKERISVAAASKLLANIVYGYKGMGLSMGTMICGWDKKGPGLYYVDSDGTRLTNNLFSVGSGSPYAYGVLDSGYKWDLSPEEACELGRKAIYHATYRDAFSGGIISVYHMKETGWVKASTDDVLQLHYKYAAEKK